MLEVEARGGFHDLALSPSILAALERAEYRQPTPIQAALIPEALAGRDVIGQAQTGTGKTAAFLLPFLNQWRDKNEPGPQAIVLAPTRELVVQVSEEARKLMPSKSCRAVPIYGGQRFREQLTAMKNGGFAIAVGTPGRVLDHLSRGTLSLAGVRYLVLDEADRMLDIGFRPDIERILRRCPQVRQTLLLSATLPPPVLRLAQRYMRDPVNINLSPATITVENIRQLYISVDPERKFELLLRVLQREKPRQCIIFCERKRYADELYRDLRQHTRRAAAMHGDLQQPVRERIMQSFRDGKITFLVATDHGRGWRGHRFRDARAGGTVDRDRDVHQQADHRGSHRRVRGPRAAREGNEGRGRNAQAGGPRLRPARQALQQPPVTNLPGNEKAHGQRPVGLHLSITSPVALAES